jgi:hypothetical protein
MIRNLLIVLILISSSELFGYPITPQTLRKQIENSKYIVIAIIDNPETKKVKSRVFDKKTGDTIEVFKMSLFGDGLAELEILKVLKGKIENDSIMVTYPSDMSNPRPPDYSHKKKVIAFLNDDDTTANFVTVGLSYGTILFEQDESTQNFEALISEYLPIAKIKNKKMKMRLTTSWLVKCCAERSTRWHGAYELNRKRHWMSYYDQSIDNEFFNYLTSEEKTTLEKIVLDSDTISYDELCLSDFVSSDKTEELKKILIFNLKFFRIFFTEDLMKRYIELDDNVELKLIYEAYLKVNLTDKKHEDEAIELNARFIEIAEN